MLVTLLGIVKLVRLVHSENALVPMLVTGRPLIVSGMLTAPPEPRYAVMVTVPLLVVYATCTSGSHRKGIGRVKAIMVQGLKLEFQPLLTLSIIAVNCGTLFEVAFVPSGTLTNIPRLEPVPAD